MERYTVHRLGSLSKTDGAERIEAYLRAQGVQTAGVQVRWDDETGSAAVSVLADRDPGDLLRAYVPTPTAAEAERNLRLADARAVLVAIAQKPRADRTPVERALLGLAVALRNLDEAI